MAATSLAVLSLVAAACSSGPAAPDAAAAPAAVAAVYNTLFNFGGSSLAAKEAAIQGGASISPGLQFAASSPLSANAGGANVKSVTIVADSVCTAKKVPTPCAQVKYDILAKNGTAVLPNQVGYATYTSGKWQVAKVTICSLIESLYSVSGKKGIPPGCA